MEINKNKLTIYFLKLEKQGVQGFLEKPPRGVGVLFLLASDYTKKNSQLKKSILISFEQNKSQK